ncbi:MAG: hypothetical protein HYW26_04745 [Candidatus Aenigmarchaeota archaeon]|nr:hypothetical protein [Candidatus Aenigmarchaeota archaeon]
MAVESDTKVVTKPPIVIPECNYDGVVKEILNALQTTPLEWNIHVGNVARSTCISFAPQLSLQSGYNAQIYPPFGHAYNGEEQPQMPLGMLDLHKVTQPLHVAAFEEMGKILHQGGFRYSTETGRVGVIRFELDVPFVMKDPVREILPLKVYIKATKRVPQAEARYSRMNIQYTGSDRSVPEAYRKGSLSIHLNLGSPNDTQSLITLERLCRLI